MPNRPRRNPPDSGRKKRNRKLRPGRRERVACCVFRQAPANVPQPLDATRNTQHVKIALLSDTHGYLDPSLERIFAGVDHILHAGDIGPDSLIAELEGIAPVTAVLGNNDSSPAFPLTQVVALGGGKSL